MASTTSLRGAGLNGVRAWVVLRIAGTAVMGSVMLLAAACENTGAGPVAPSQPVGATSRTMGTSSGTKTSAMDTLTGTWRGRYSWDCGNGRTGTATATFGIDGATDSGQHSGYASYLGGRAAATVQRFVGDINDPTTWSRDPDGRVVYIEVLESPGNFANNEFTGLLDGSQIVGTTLNGDTVAFPGFTGCSALRGPSGTFSIEKL